MLGAKSGSGPSSLRRRRWGLGLVVFGLVLAVALFVVGRRALQPIGEGPVETPAPSEATPSRVLESGIATLADIALIEDDFSRNAALYALIGDATRTDIEEWLGEVDTLPARRHRSDIARVLYIRFAVLDPEAALQHALRGATKASWLVAIFRTWGQLDPDAAAAKAGTLLPFSKAIASRTLLALDLPRAELFALTARLDESPSDDLQRHVQLATGTPRRKPSEYLLAEIEARTHARREGESYADAWNRAISLEGDALVRQILVEQTVVDWALADPEAAMAAVGAWDTDEVFVPNVTGGGFAPNQPIRSMLQARIMWIWARGDAQAAMSWTMRQEPAAMQKHAPMVLAALAEQSPAEAVARLADLPDALREQAAGNLLWTLARTDLDRAMRLFESLSIEQQSDNAMALSQELVSDRSPREALDWALSLDRRIRPREVGAVLQRLYFRDHAEALRLLDSIEDPAIRAAAAPGLVAGEVQRNAEEALAWARNFQPVTERVNLVVQVFHTWARLDPGVACRALLETRGGSMRDRAAATMMPNVVAHDSRLAERLFDTIETAEQQAVAAQTLYRHFTDIDPRTRKAERYRKYLPPEDDDPPGEETS